MAVNMKQVRAALEPEEPNYDKAAKLGAKAEGEFVWYTSVNAEDIQRINELFQKRYPYIKVNAVRLTSARIVQRHVSESQAGNYLADILDTSDSRIEFFRANSARHISF